MDTTLFDALRYRSEGTDLDFKQAQYRFVKGLEADKAELLKDVLAMSNAWREGVGYILLGFKESRPNPAEVVGIGEHLDDAALQQFVNSKVKPKLSFTYQEHTYEGKMIGIISIPRQARPFYLQHAYGGLKSNVVYVRRGSSTDEAEPPEIAKMVASDAGKGNVSAELNAAAPDNAALKSEYERVFLAVGKLPDYEEDSEGEQFGLQSMSLWHANRDYWRDLARFLLVRLATVEIQFSLRNASQFSLTGTKLEIAVEAVDGQRTRLLLGEDLPELPKRRYRTMDFGQRALSSALSRAEPRTVIDDGGGQPTCHVRLGTLLPGESGRASDSIAVRSFGPGRVIVKCRILAAELSDPILQEVAFNVIGDQRALELQQLTAVVKEPLSQRILAPFIARIGAASNEDE